MHWMHSTNKIMHTHVFAGKGFSGGAFFNVIDSHIDVVGALIQDASNKSFDPFSSNIDE